MTIIAHRRDTIGAMRPSRRLLRSDVDVSFLRLVAHALVRLARLLSFQLELRRTRLSLGELTDDQLRDIGITRPEAETEARRSLFVD